MKPVTMKDIQVGWWGLFDAMYGPEKVLAIESYALAPARRAAAAIGTSNEGGIWPVIKFRVSDERSVPSAARNIIRFPHESVMAVIYPSDAAETADVG